MSTRAVLSSLTPERVLKWSAVGFCVALEALVIVAGVRVIVGLW